jgi:uncharacterized protein
MTSTNVKEADRLAVRERPKGQPIMHQNWGKLHFMHWRIDESILRPQIAHELEIDLFEGSAWVAITPFAMWDVRAFPPLVPAVPGIDSMYELNVRTYVSHRGVPGVWFFSLDIDSAVAALGGRKLFHLPYYTSEINFAGDEGNDDLIEYEVVRDDEPKAHFSGSFKPGKRLGSAQPGSKEFFLTERYVLYTENQGALYQARIHHQPWPLQASEVLEFSSTMLEANGLPPPDGEPLVHYAEEVNVDIWPLQRLSN